MLETCISFGAVLALCLFFAAFPRVPGGAAPLLAVSSVMVWFAAAGVLGVLLPALWVFYALCGLLAVLALWRGRGALLKKLLCPGFVLFAGLALLLLLLFWVRQPVLREWDEFSFWGTAAKLVKLNGSLYTTAEMGWFWTATQSPGLVLLGWFAQALGPGFAAWKVYWAYDLLLLACIAALVSAFSFRRWRVAVPLAMVGLLTPFFFHVYYQTVYLDTTWLSAYGDLPAGMLAGGALVLFLGMRHMAQADAVLPRLRFGGRKAAARHAAPGTLATALAPVLAAVLPLAALALTKDITTLPVALVAAGVMAADCLLFGFGPRLRRAAQQAKKGPAGSAAALLGPDSYTAPQPALPVVGTTPDDADSAAMMEEDVAALAEITEAHSIAADVTTDTAADVPAGADRPAVGKPRRELLCRALAAVLLFAAVLLPFAMWSSYVSAVVAGKPAAEGGQTNITTGQALGQAIGMLLGLQPRSERFVQVGAAMQNRYLGLPAADGTVGEHLSMAGGGLITTLLVLALFVLAALLAGRGRLRRQVLLVGGLLAAGFAVFQFSIFTFYAFIDNNGGTGLVDYDRYTNTYLVAWFMAGVCLLALAARVPLAARGMMTGLRPALARVGVLLLACGMLLRFGGMVRPGYSVLDWPDSAYTGLRAEQETADRVRRQTGDDARIFFVSQGGDGGAWFRYSCYLLPAILDYSVTGGRSFALPEQSDDERQSPQALLDYMQQAGCDYLLLLEWDAAFAADYGMLFTQPPAEDTGPLLYQRQPDGRFAQIPLQPVSIAQAAG